MKYRPEQIQTNQSGFSYIDVMIAIVILMIGILGAAGALTANLLRSVEAEKQIVAKQTALSAIESIFSARDIARAGSIDGWNSVGNVGTNPDENGIPKGLFLIGWRPIREDLGADGVAGTADDACDEPNPCDVNGKINGSKIISGFLRKIEITDVPDPERPLAISRRRIDVTVKYFVNQLSREETVSTIIVRLND